MEGWHERFRKCVVFGEPPAVDLEELSSWTSHSARGSPPVLDTTTLPAWDGQWLVFRVRCLI